MPSLAFWSSSDVQLLQRKTEGWPAALRNRCVDALAYGLALKEYVQGLLGVRSVQLRPTLSEMLGYASGRNGRLHAADGHS